MFLKQKTKALIPLAISFIATGLFAENPTITASLLE